MKKIIFLFFLTLILRLIFFDTSYFIWDESIYLMHGKSITGETIGYQEINLRPPLVPVLISGIYKFGLNYEVFSKLLLIILNSLVVVPMYYLGLVINKKIALISSIIIAAMPISIFNSRLIMTDHLGMVLALSTIVLFYYSLKNIKLFYLGGIFLALSILTKFTNLLLLVILFPFIFKHYKNVKHIIISASLFLLTLLPYFIFNIIKFNNPIFTFLKAWQVVAEPLKTELSFFFYIFNDMFGLMFLILLVLGLAFFLKTQKKDFKFYSIIYMFFIILLYSIKILYKGVARPPEIEWEAARVILLLLPFSCLFISYVAINISERFTNKNLILALFIIIGLLFLKPQYIRTYTPTIEYESGLRYVTKDMGYFLKELQIDAFSCLGNCPSIAYYSQSNMELFFNKDNLINSNSKNIVVFHELDSKEYLLEKKFCKEDWCTYFYQKS